MIKITALDHLVLTVADMQKTIDFYTTILGMQEITFGDNRKALLFGTQKINLHQKGAEILPNAQNADCGTADLCLYGNSTSGGYLCVTATSGGDFGRWDCASYGGSGKN